MIVLIYAPFIEKVMMIKHANTMIANITMNCPILFETITRRAYSTLFCIKINICFAILNLLVYDFRGLSLT